MARGYLGAGLHPVREGGVRGAMVMSLDEAEPGKAAEIARHHPFMGRRAGARAARTAAAGARPGQCRNDPVTLSVLRGGEARDVAVTVGKPLG